MIENVVNIRNMQLACIHVVQNKGSAGVDRMPVSALKEFVLKNRPQIADALKKGDYGAQPILGVSIPKSNGKMRLLGIPTVIDRWLQQCVAQAITPRFEIEFKSHSYGFRLNREKSGIRRPVNFKLLGYECVPTYEKGTRGKYQLVVSESGWKDLKEKIRTVTRKTAPLSLAERTRKLKEVQRGWVNYFRKGPSSELSWQTRNTRQLGAQPTAVLHLERLEDRA